MILLLRPKLLSVRVALAQALSTPEALVRTVVLSLFALGFAVAVYMGMQLVTQKINENFSSAYISPSTTLGLILLFILIMISISATVNAIGALFHSRDLDLILSSPIGRPRFYFGKLCDVALSSSWLVVVFGLPALMGFGTAYHGGWDYAAAIAVALVPYFIIPSALALIVATVLGAIIPLNRTREVMIVVSVVILFGISILVELLVPSSDKLKDINVILALIARVLKPHGLWSPAYWSASILGEKLAGHGAPVAQFLTLLYAAAVGAVACSYLVVNLLHPFAFSRATVLRLSARKARSKAPRSIFVWLGIMSQPTRALMRRERLTFLRDLSQSSQLLLLLGLCVIYLSNLRVLHAVNGLAPDLRLWWESFLLFANAVLGAFVISAMCTRLVFTSVSLEGACWWLLQSSPVAIEEILRAKFWAWYGPVAALSTIIFVAGGLAIGAPLILIALKVSAALFLSYGMVGLAVGLGARFANFDWEHPGQLAASFGSLCFMLFSVAYITTALAGAAVVIFMLGESGNGLSMPQWQWYTASTCAFLLMAYVSILVTREALRWGARGLRARMSR